MRVCVDAGHGVEASGGTPGEHELVLTYAKNLRDELERRGHLVAMTREGRHDVSFAHRVTVANQFEAKCFVSLHMNGSSNATANGMWVLHAGSHVGQRFAGDLFAELRKIPGLEDDDPEAEVYPDGTGWTGGRQLWVLQRTAMPAALVELGFLTNRLDRQQLEDPATVQPVCQAISDGIEIWAGIEAEPVIPVPEPPPVEDEPDAPAPEPEPEWVLPEAPHVVKRPHSFGLPKSVSREPVRVEIPGSDLPAPLLQGSVGNKWVIAEDYLYRDEPRSCLLEVRAGFEFNLASVPRAVWWAIAPFDLSIVGALVHDYLYHIKGLAGCHTYSRHQADKLFRDLMRREGVPGWRIKAAYRAVRLFGGSHW